MVAPADRSATAAAVDTRVLHCEGAEELGEHLLQANEAACKRKPRRHRLYTRFTGA
jgi:hypothetical protein